MLISEIVPYPDNARNNEKAIPVVAESIKEFGLRGTIGLESPDNPVIVWGHTRVAACKSLGWEEIPEEKIEYCTDLTAEQVKAFRLADNRTGEVATWNKALLKKEMRSIKELDMSRFQFDFKSKNLPYGAERLKTDRAYNLHLVNVFDCEGKEGYPTLRAVDFAPTDMIPFNFCKSAKTFDAGVHFCVDDYQFERVWNKPEAYIDLLRKFECVVCPDFSVYLDMPLPMKKWNIYRSRALGHWWQKQGLTVVPNVTWSDKASIGYSLEGIPKHSTVFLSTVGVTKDKDAREICLWGMGRMMAMLEPARVLLLGSDLGFDFGKTETRRYKTKAFSKER